MPRMALLIFLPLTIALCIQNWLPEFSAKLVFPLHRLCLASAPKGPWIEFYQALICGAGLPPRSLTYSLQATGLLHIIVLSGSQFLLIELAAKWLSNRQTNPLPHRDEMSLWIRIFLLLFFTAYTAMTLGKASLMRFLIAWTLRWIAKANRLFWSQLQICFYSGFLCLALVPAWIQSLSLLISWTAAMVFAATRGSRKEDGKWKTKILQAGGFYLSLIPLLFGWGLSSPIAILTQVFLAPMLALILFPLCVLSFLIPYFSALTDQVWKLMQFLLLPVGAWLPVFGNTTEKLSLPLIWIYVLTLQAILLWREHRLRRV
jgi:hypothetical protein